MPDRTHPAVLFWFPRNSMHALLFFFICRAERQQHAPSPYPITPSSFQLLEAYQMCGAAFLPSIGWRVSEGSRWADGLGWITQLMSVPYLVLESIPHPSLSDIVEGLGGLRCGQASYLWMSSSVLVLTIGLALPCALAVLGMALALAYACLISCPKGCCYWWRGFELCESNDNEFGCSRMCALCYKGAVCHLARAPSQGRENPCVPPPSPPLPVSECRCVRTRCCSRDELDEVYLLECPAACGGFGLVAGPAYAVMSLGLGPLALTVKQFPFSISNQWCAGCCPLLALLHCAVCAIAMQGHVQHPILLLVQLRL